jgi:hypothetical protein
MELPPVAGHQLTLSKTYSYEMLNAGPSEGWRYEPNNHTSQVLQIRGALIQQSNQSVEQHVDGFGI